MAARPTYDQIEAALATLSTADRHLLWIAVVEGHPHGAIARHLGCSVADVAHEVRRAQERFLAAMASGPTPEGRPLGGDGGRYPASSKLWPSSRSFDDDSTWRRWTNVTRPTSRTRIPPATTQPRTSAHPTMSSQPAVNDQARPPHQTAAGSAE